jgi:predicted transcriptional regulator
MSRSVQLNTRVDETTAQRLDLLAQATGRTKSRLFYEAITAYIDNELAFIQAVERGRADIREGRFTEWEDFEKELDALLDDGMAH